MSDPVKAIARHIQRRCGGLADLSLECGDSKPWHSLLFDGGRHEIALRLGGDHVEDAINALHDEVVASDFTIPGHLVAEIRVAAIDRSPGHALVRLDALTIEY